MHDVAEFLKAHEPFSGLDEADLDRLAERAKVEFFTAGTVIFQRASRLPTRSGSFAAAPWSWWSGVVCWTCSRKATCSGRLGCSRACPTGWEARAREDTLCYALAAEDVVPLLSGPAGLRFVARSLLMLPRPGEAGDSRCQRDRLRATARGGPGPRAAGDL